MGEIARGLIADYPQVLSITSKSTVTFKGTSYGTTNLLLGSYTGLDGLKTGYTDPAGYCFIGTAKRNGRRIIAVTMGSTLESRYPDTRVLLDYGFEVAQSVIDDYFGVKKANTSDANLVINGVSRPLTAYLIDDYHYFKLRDVAFLLDGTEKQFGVAAWDPENSTAILFTGIPYEANGTELAALGDSRPYEPSNTTIFFNEIKCEFDIYLIDDSNYFRMKDLSEIMGFSAIWIDETRTVIIDTTDTTDTTEALEDAA